MIFEKIVELLSEQFSVEPETIALDTSFEDMGADSLDIVELSMALEEEFDIAEMAEEDIAGIHTVGDLVSYLKTKVGED